MMHVRLLLCLIPFLVVLVHAGGSDLPEDQVEEVLALYQKHCKSYGSSVSGGYGSDNSGGSGGYGGYGSGPGTNLGQNVNIVCKEGQDEYEPPRKQIIRVPPSDKPKKQIVFVEAPAYKVKHEINLISNEAQSPKTVIYVLPQKATHALNVYNKYGVPQNPPKPQVFFLKNPSNVQPIATPGPTPSKPVYGLPNYSSGSESRAVEVQSPVQYSSFDPSQLGPNYEIVNADGETQNHYQNLFSSIDTTNSQQQVQVQPQIQIMSHIVETEIGGNGQNTQKKRPIKVSQTGKSYAVLNQGLPTASPTTATTIGTFNFPKPEIINNQEPVNIGSDDNGETLVQPLTGNLFSSLSSKSYGRVIFPQESIQNYQVQSFKEGEKKPSADSDITADNDKPTTKEGKSLRELIRAFEVKQRLQDNRQIISTSTTTSTTTKRPPTTTVRGVRNRLNLFDQNYVNNLIETARNAASNLNQQPARQFNQFRFISNIRNSDRDSRSLFPIQYETLSSTTNKRSIESHQGFEIIPANFVSYNYYKSDI